MSSYHSSFTYLDKNSKSNLGWMIVHFEADVGEMDSYLSQEQIYTDSYNGTRRILYGTRWNATALIKITVIKQSGTSFSLLECRNAYKWLTGNPNASWLDLYAGDVLKYSFLGTVQDVKPQKLDARTVGLNIYFESISPWAYSPIKTFSGPLKQSLVFDSNGIVTTIDGEKLLTIGSDGTLYNSLDNDNGFTLLNDGTITPGMSIVEIDNQTDDLYDYVYLDVVFKNINSTSISIKNTTTGEETYIDNVFRNETINLKSGQFIISDRDLRIFGDDFNFVWPRLVPGLNRFEIGCSGTAYIEMSYRHPMKISDCAIDLDISENDMCCGEYTDSVMPSSISWGDITDTPTTLSGYGITDAYTTFDVDSRITNVTVDKEELNSTLNSILNK